jgi:hypothetical protein
MGNTVGHDIHDKAHGHLGGANRAAGGHVGQAVGIIGGNKSAAPGNSIGKSPTTPLDPT